MKRARKLLAFLLFMAMLLALTACGGSQKGNGMNEDNNDKQGVQEKEPFDAQKVISQLEVTEYRTTALKGVTPYGDGERQLCYLVKNNSDYNVTLSFNITTYNADKEVVQIVHKNIEAVEKGTEAVLKCTKLEEYVSCTYEITVRECQDYMCINSNISHELIKTKNKVLLTVTNGHSKGAVVNGYLLCVKNGEMVYCHTLTGNFAPVVSSGESHTDEWNVAFDSYFDSYKVVVCGKKYG